jgi:DNA-binding MurR/RpiR family transcriptional regulator
MIQDYSIADLAKVFSVSRPTVYRTLQAKQATTAARTSDS